MSYLRAVFMLAVLATLVVCGIALVKNNAKLSQTSATAQTAASSSEASAEKVDSLEDSFSQLRAQVAASNKDKAALEKRVKNLTAELEAAQQLPEDDNELQALLRKALKEQSWLKIELTTLKREFESEKAKHLAWREIVRDGFAGIAANQQ